MPPDRPTSEHPKVVRRWLLEQLAVLWTESGSGWQVHADKNSLTRSEGDFEFELHLRPKPYGLRTGWVLVYPEWRIRSLRWIEWKRSRPLGVLSRWPAPADTRHYEVNPNPDWSRAYTFADGVRALSTGRLHDGWLLVTPINKESLMEPPDVGRPAPLEVLRRDVSPIFNAVSDIDAFLALELRLSTRELLEYLLVMGRRDLAQAHVDQLFARSSPDYAEEVRAWIRAHGSGATPPVAPTGAFWFADEIIDLGLSAPGTVQGN